MNSQPCPNCDGGQLIDDVIENHSVRIGGLNLVVPQAFRQRCEACGETFVSAAELKRWEDLARKASTELGIVPSPEKVKSLREKLGLSAADFGSLLGVTRQTVHAWERSDTGGIQLSPASLLLTLIEKEISGDGSSILSSLMSNAKERGIEIKSNRLNAMNNRAQPPRPGLRKLRAGVPGCRHVA